jgi:hypothetical protein
MPDDVHDLKTYSLAEIAKIVLPAEIADGVTRPIKDRVSVNPP